MNEDGTKTNFNNEQGKAVLEFWDRLLNTDKVYKIGYETGLGEGTDAFATGKLAPSAALRDNHRISRLKTDNINGWKCRKN